MSQSYLTRDVADELRRSDWFKDLSRSDDIEAICLFGSVARGTADASSDVDLLVVVPDRRNRQAELPRMVREGLHGQRAQVKLMTTKSLRDQLANRTVFGSHLAREGVVLVDKAGEVRDVLEQYPPDAPVRESADRLMAQLRIYDDLAWCHGHYLFCLADLYAWGRAAAMLGIARLGVFKFGREEVFEEFGRRYPELADSAAAISQLRPFWGRVHGRSREEFPFDPVGAHEETRRARDACRALVTKSL